jgi:carboxymethylenebutenolidase
MNLFRSLCLRSWLLALSLSFLCVGQARSIEPCCPPDLLQKAADSSAFAAAHPLKATTPTPTLLGTNVRLTDFGAEDIAYLSIPTVQPRGGVVLIHEWWGLNDHLKATADRFAAQGYVALAVDIYNGKVTTDPALAAELMKSVRPASALRTIAAGVRFLKESPRFKTETVATIGWCLGGGLSLQAGLRNPNVDAIIMYYGAPETDPDKLKALRIPLLGIWAARDEWITPAAVQTFDQNLKNLEVSHEFHSFDAEHAFANPSNANYDAAAADKAWNLTLDFLGRSLGQPRKDPNLFEKIFKKKDTLPKSES